MADKFAYAYFNPDGTLREFIIDPSVRQGNVGFNKIRFYWESEEPFTALSLSYINTDDEDAQWSEPRVIVKKAVSFTIPAIQDYDPRYFKYGKTYEGYEFSIPEDILSQTGNIALSLFVINQGTRIAYLGLMTMYISETGASFQSTIDKSQYYYLLEKIQEIAEDDGSGGAFVTIDRDTGTLTEEELELIGNPATVIKYVLSQEDELYYFDRLALANAYYKRTRQLSYSDGSIVLVQDDIIINTQTGSYNKLNNVIYSYTKDKLDSLLAAKQDALTFDSTPTENSNNPVTSSGLYTKFESIEQLIPAQASAQNQLADKDFVNSSIATNTAYFLGTYNIVTDLGLTTSATHSEVAAAIATKLASLSITVSNNDYVFIAYPDAIQPNEYTQFDRYKYNADDAEWDYEYTLNNSSFTAAQWAAINSGITAEMVGNFVTTNTEQTITGKKTIDNQVDFKASGATHYWSLVGSNYTFDFKYDNARKFNLSANQMTLDVNLIPGTTNTWDLGSSSNTFKDLYLGGNMILNSDTIQWKMIASNDYTVSFYRDTSLKANYITTQGFGFDGTLYCLNPQNLGKSTAPWKDLYTAGKIYCYNSTNYWSFDTHSDGHFYIAKNGTNYVVLRANMIYPSNANQFNIGTNVQTFKNGYFAGVLSNGTDDVTIADLAALITYAKGQGWIS